MTIYGVTDSQYERHYCYFATLADAEAYADAHDMYVEEIEVR